MDRDRPLPAWLLWFLGAWPWVMLILFVAICVVLAVFGSRLDERLGAIEAEIYHELPSAYAAPDLAVRAAPEVDVSALDLHQVVYVPAYSHIYVAGGHPLLLEATLSIRNTDPRRPIYVRSVAYYDTGGAEARRFVDRLIRLEPLETIDFVVEQHDTQGGSGANFLVEWHAVAGTEPPLVEAVMAGIAGSHSLGFVREGRPLRSAH